jgi:hypothetical protein
MEVLLNAGPGGPETLRRIGGIADSTIAHDGSLSTSCQDASTRKLRVLSPNWSAGFRIRSQQQSVTVLSVELEVFKAHARKGWPQRDHPFRGRVGSAVP